MQYKKIVKNIWICLKKILYRQPKKLRRKKLRRSKQPELWYQRPYLHTFSDHQHQHKSLLKYTRIGRSLKGKLNVFQYSIF